MGERHAVVVGGGIGGLATAVALTRTGWRVEVLERAPAVAGLGAGLSLWPNALRALDLLGLGEQVRESALSEAAAGIRTAEGTWLSRTDTAELGRRHGRLAMVHRGDLLEILVSALPSRSLRMGVEVLEARADGTVIHSAGKRRADLVAGADGIHSAVRRSILPDAPAPRYAGYAAWRAITKPVIVPGGVESWGRGERFGYAPMRDGRVYFYATANLPHGDGGGGHGELRRRFGGWHDPIPALLAAVDEDALLHHEIHYLPPLTTYVSGRVALAGDAAHAMTPDLGQGACQALEDAVELAAAMDGGGLDEYDRSRRPRSQWIASRARRIGAAGQWSSRAAVGARNAALRLTPDGALLRSLAPVLDWHPPTPTVRRGA